MKKIEKLKQAFTSGGLSRRDFMQRASALGVGAAMASLALKEAEASTPKKGGTLKVAKGHGSTTDSLDPGLVENGYTIGLSFGFQGYLTQVAADGSLEPSVAESWEASDDASRWTFKLRKGVEFHNGRSVTAGDVVASINHHRGEDSSSAAAPLVKPVTDIKADGDDTVVIQLDAGNADFPFILSDYHIPVMPAKDGKMDWKPLVGCGAYRLDHHEAGVSSELSRHVNHWTDDAGHVDEVQLLAIVDLNARTTALVSGDVDAIDRVDLKTAALLGRKPGVTLQTTTGTLHYSFPMLCDRAPFNDVNLRQAVKYAFNRQELVDKILFGYGQPGNDHPIGSNQRYFNTELKQRHYDPDKAKFHLKKSGHDRFAIKLNASEAAFGGAVDAAVLFQSSAKAGGLDVEVVRQPNDGFWADHWIKSPFITSYWSGRVVEDQMFSTAYQSGVPWNENLWSNERFDKLLIEARAELDETRRREMYFEMQAILHNEGGPAIPMFASYVFGTTDRIAVPETMGANWDMDGERWMERWWVA